MILLTRRLVGLFLSFLTGLFVSMTGGSTVFASQEPALLTLHQAEQMAVARAPLIARSQALSLALEQQATAVSALPDPKLKLGVVNLSTDSYEFGDEPMTQAVIAVQQAFPPRDLRKSRREQMQAMARTENAQAQLLNLQTLRAVRNAWADTYLHFHSEQLLKSSRQVFEQLVQITTFKYGVGRGNQHDVIRAQLELQLIDDRHLNTLTSLQISLAELSKWVGGAAAAEDLNLNLNDFPTQLSMDKIEQLLGNHPSLQFYESQKVVGEYGKAAAQAGYSPTWMLDLSYGYREQERSDFMSAMVSIDLPIFTHNRQDAQVAASQQRIYAAQNAMEEQQQVLQRTLTAKYAAYGVLTKRLDLYKNEVLPKAKQNAEATLNAYQSGVSEFEVLLRARLKELDSRLDALRLQVERANVISELLYLEGR